MRRTGTKRFFGIFHILNMASSENDLSDVEVDNGEGVAHDGLPSGSERGVIEYYFNGGLTYRHVALMLGKHQI